MNYNSLGDNVEIKTEKENDTEGVFTISGLYPGYGTTIANSLRRVLLSSLPGAAITFVKIKGADHEFTTIEGVVENIIEIGLNLKKVRFRMFNDEPQTLSLKVKGESEVTAKDIKANSEIEIVNGDEPIATLTSKNADLDIEITVERGLGYVPAHARNDEKLAIGVVALDSLFSPVTKVNYTIDNIRVGDKTDYNQINLEIVTDGAIKPGDALLRSVGILKDHFSKIETILNGGEIKKEDEPVKETPKEEEPKEDNEDKE